MVKNPPANVGDLRDAGWIPGLGRSPGGGYRQSTPVSLPREPHGHRTPAGYGSLGSRGSDMTEVTACVCACAHTHTSVKLKKQTNKQIVGPHPRVSNSAGL